MATGRPGRRHLKIGELERALGVTRDQVHHYIELGLVPAPEKSSATVAWYGPEHLAAVARVRAIRDGGGSLLQAQRWLVGPLARLGVADCAALVRWVQGPRATALPAIDEAVALVDAALARARPEQLAGGAGSDPGPWLAELAARWAEREESARMALAREAVEAAASARQARWWPVDPARVAGGALRAAVLDRATPGDDAAGDEERARLGLMLAAVAPVPSARLPTDGAWSAAARGAASMRARRWSAAVEALARARAGAPGAALSQALAWCADAMSAARAGDGVLAMVARLGELRAMSGDAADDPCERLRLRWTLAVTWLALPARWEEGAALRELDAARSELEGIAVDARLRATGELDVAEANVWLALSTARLRAGDRAGSIEAARRAAAFGGPAAEEAARRGRRASRAV